MADPEGVLDPELELFVNTSHVNRIVETIIFLQFFYVGSRDSIPEAGSMAADTGMDSTPDYLGSEGRNSIM